MNLEKFEVYLLGIIFGINNIKKLLLFAFVSYIYMGNRLGVINKSLLQINDSFINNHEYKTK